MKNSLIKSIKIGAKRFSIASHASDDYLLKMGSNFEPSMCDLFTGLIKPEYSVLDIGANIGCTTLLFANVAKEVDSFEPSPSTFQYLTQNVKSSGFANVHLHNIGLGLKDESLELTSAPANSSGAYISNLTQASEGHIIETVILKNGDNFVNKKIDFIKIDVEGFEKNVLAGLKESIIKNRSVVVLELNHWCLNVFQRTSIPDFFDYLLDLFPIVYAVDKSRYADLHILSERYHVMNQHILRNKYLNLVCAFDQNQVRHILNNYSKGPIFDWKSNLRPLLIKIKSLAKL